MQHPVENCRGGLRGIARSRGAVLIFGVLSALCLGTLAAKACQGTKVQFEDDFKDPDPSWGANTDNSAMKDGMAVLTPPVNGIWWWVTNAFVFENAMLCTKFKMTDYKDPKATKAGLLFWMDNSNKYYIATVTGDGRMGVSRHLDSGWANVVPYNAVPSAKTKPGDENEVEVAIKGNTATLYLNGAKVANFRGQPPSGGGSIGMYAESETDRQDTWPFELIRAADIP